MYEKMKNMIKNGVNKGIDDTQAIRTGLYKWLGRDSQRCQSFVPFGTFGTPQDGTQGLLFQIRCRESSIVALDGDPINRIKKDTVAGEYGIGNPLTLSNIYFKENGNVVIELPSGDALIEVLTGQKIGLGEDGTNPLAGVVTGESLDPVTGVPFPDKSTTVFARKI